MSKEIERKFLLKEYPESIHPLCHSFEQISQTYLSVADDSELRIRHKHTFKKNRKKVFTDKYSLTYKTGNGLVRGEQEIEIDKDTYENLMKGNTTIPISKVRRYIDWNGKEITIDIYNGELHGLIIAEVEFKSVEDANKFTIPYWMGSEITNNKTYKNKNLWKQIQGIEPEDGISKF